jgi:hypothetical protein
MSGQFVFPPPRVGAELGHEWQGMSAGCSFLVSTFASQLI